ncbi:MAG: efflux RND transporter periplasmic adaptor subunit [Bacteroidales bacterium]|nr:efflux RND transporter periplasmic adaptor subunit [Bacteroidales bacterium]
MKNLFHIIFILIIATYSRCSSDPDHKNHSTSEFTEETHADHESSVDSSGYKVLTLKRQPFASALRAGGRIIADNKDLIVITAKSSGVVRFKDNYLFPGVRIMRGQTLFLVTGDQLADDNTELKLRQIKADLDKASVNFKRAEILISDKIITEEHYLSLKNEYEKALIEYDNLSATYGNNGNTVTGPDHGYIKEIYVSEGQKVIPGEPLASMITEHNLILKADVSPDNLDILSSVESANFKVGYSDKVYKTAEMNGRKISYGKSTGDNSFYIPVYFRMDHDPGLIEGTFAEVYLIAKNISDALVVPNSALMEEFGKLYVFVVHDHGDFVKRYVTTGYGDGENTTILSGLSENEKIVSSGAYLVKLSRMASSAPAHNH